MTIRTIKGRIVLAIVLVGCIPLLIGLMLPTCRDAFASRRDRRISAVPNRPPTG